MWVELSPNYRIYNAIQMIGVDCRSMMHYMHATRLLRISAPQIVLIGETWAIPFFSFIHLEVMSGCEGIGVSSRGSVEILVASQNARMSINF